MYTTTVLLRFQESKDNNYYKKEGSDNKNTYTP